LPIAVLGLFVATENIGRRREFWKVNVIDVADRLCEIPQIVFLREARKLRNIVQPDIDQTLDPGFFQPSEERLGRLLP
jgi:hypothetical protein